MELRDTPYLESTDYTEYHSTAMIMGYLVDRILHRLEGMNLRR